MKHIQRLWVSFVIGALAYCVKYNIQLQTAEFYDNQMSDESETTNTVSILTTTMILKTSPEETTWLICALYHATIASNDARLMCTRS
jgi:hypothetical protein